MFNGPSLRHNKSWRKAYQLLDPIGESDEPSTSSPEVNDQLASFFTSSEGVKTQIPSLFEKIEGFFDSDEIRAPPNTTVSPSPHSNVQCICFNCWGPVSSGSSASKTWKSLECGIPILPVFVGSPTDSLLMYGATAEGKPESLISSAVINTTETTMDSTILSHSTSEDSHASAGWRNVASFVASSTIDSNTRKLELEEENELLQKKILLQSEVIQKLMELSTVSEKLVKIKAR